MAIKLRVDELCKERGIPLYKLAKEIKVCIQTPYRWVSGEDFPSRKNLEKLSDFFGVDVKGLFK
jgi:transcriptional regulator with XRE-family HTH domain